MGSYAVLDDGKELSHDGTLYTLYYPNDCQIRHLSTREARATLRRVTGLFTSDEMSVIDSEDLESMPSDTSDEHSPLSEFLQEMPLRVTTFFGLNDLIVSVQRVNPISWVTMHPDDREPSALMPLNETVERLESFFGNNSPEYITSGSSIVNYLIRREMGTIRMPGPINPDFPTQNNNNDDE